MKKASFRIATLHGTADVTGWDVSEDVAKAAPDFAQFGPFYCHRKTFRDSHGYETQRWQLTHGPTGYAASPPKGTIRETYNFSMRTPDEFRKAIAHLPLLA